MRIGIITFHNAKNYGAFFQAYALSKVIESLLGSDGTVEVLDYKCKYIDKDYKARLTFNGFKQTIYSVLSFFPIVRRNYRFDRILREKINLSKGYTEKTILSANNYDCYIAGSDMIWHWHTVDGKEIFDANYFLDFVTDSNKKNSYAASFGTDSIPDNYKDFYYNHLSTFNKISIREKSGISFLKDLNKSVNVNLDPSLLLDKEKWNLLNLKKRKHGKYILVYEVGKLTDRMVEYAKKLSELKGYKIIYLNSEYNVKNQLIHKNSYFGFSPADFITWFSSAEYVITNSFHGTAFSIIYEKPFLSEIDSWIKNNRSLELLLLLGLEERILTDDCDIDKPINWESVQEKLQLEREKSYCYLKQIVENEHE